MSRKILEIAGVAALVVLAGVGVVSLVPKAGEVRLGNATASFVEADGGFQITTSGTLVTGYKCATSTWNPGSLTVATGTSPATTTDIALSGAALGDICTASLSSATTTDASIECNIAQAATATIQLSNIGRNNALDYATGTAKVCFTH